MVTLFNTFLNSLTFTGSAISISFFELVYQRVIIIPLIVFVILYGKAQLHHLNVPCLQVYPLSFAINWSNSIVVTDSLTLLGQFLNSLTFRFSAIPFHLNQRVIIIPLIVFVILYGKAQLHHLNVPCLQVYPLSFAINWSNSIV